jgi:hypothetical protein
VRDLMLDKELLPAEQSDIIFSYVDPKSVGSKLFFQI